MKTALLFVGLSAPSVLTAQVNPPHSARDRGRPYRKGEGWEIAAPRNSTTGAWKVNWKLCASELTVTLFGWCS